MADITRLEHIDFSNTFISVLIILAAILAITKIVVEFSKLIGKPVKWVKIQNKGIETTEKLVKKHEEFESSFKQLEQKVDSMTDIVVNVQIRQMRTTILDMASAISENNRWYSVEQLTRAVKDYDEYERVLKANGLENGEVEDSIKVIKNALKAKRENMPKTEVTSCH